MKTSTIEFTSHEMEFDPKEKEVVFRSTLEVRVPERKAANCSLPGLVLCTEIKKEDLESAYAKMACDFDRLVKTQDEILAELMDEILSVDMDEDIEELPSEYLNIDGELDCECIGCTISRLLEELDSEGPR